MPKAENRRRGTIWSNLRWIHPVRMGKGSGVKGLKAKLKYFTYRDDRDVAAPRGGRRWVDHGLGGTHKDIAANCQQLASDDRLAWSVMLSPKPRLLHLIEDETDRRAFVENLTEAVMSEWFEARGYDEPRYAYVIHDRATHEDGQSQVHSHVILPGTAESMAGRERFDNRPSDLRQFNSLVEDLFELHMDRQLGQGWRVQWAAIQREEALGRWLKAQEAESLPDNLSALAEQLHGYGLTSEHIPPQIRTAEDLNTWLDTLRHSDDLETWFGSPTR